MLQRSLERARARRSDEGFTLIELLIVIIILGILAAIVVFSVSGITNKGDTAACQASQSTIDTAAEAFVANTTGTPPAASSLTLAQLYPKYLHSNTVTIKGTLYPSSTQVSAIDAITC